MSTSRERQSEADAKIDQNRETKESKPRVLQKAKELLTSSRRGGRDSSATFSNSRDAFLARRRVVTSRMLPGYERSQLTSLSGESLRSDNHQAGASLPVRTRALSQRMLGTTRSYAVLHAPSEASLSTDDDVIREDLHDLRLKLKPIPKTIEFPRKSILRNATMTSPKHSSARTQTSGRSTRDGRKLQQLSLDSLTNTSHLRPTTHDAQCNQSAAVLSRSQQFLSREQINRPLLETSSSCLKLNSQPNSRHNSVTSLNGLRFPAHNNEVVMATLRLKPASGRFLGDTVRQQKSDRNKQNPRRYTQTPASRRSPRFGGGGSSNANKKNVFEFCVSPTINPDTSREEDVQRKLSTFENGFNALQDDPTDTFHCYVSQKPEATPLSIGERQWVVDKKPMTSPGKRRKSTQLQQLRRHSTRHARNLNHFMKYFQYTKTLRNQKSAQHVTGKMSRNVRLSFSDFFVLFSHSDANQDVNDAKSRLVRFKTSDEIREFKPSEPIKDN